MSIQIGQCVDDAIRVLPLSTSSGENVKTRESLSVYYPYQTSVLAYQRRYSSVAMLKPQFGCQCKD